MLRLLVAVLIVKVTAAVVLGYVNYFPPNFQSDFLIGREAYFWGSYRIAFYAHILSGPCALALGLVLLSDSFRVRCPKWHRAIGKGQVALIVLLLVPSGLWMAPYAATGVIAAIGFFVLGVGTAACAVTGWRLAVSRQFGQHRHWMTRCFILLTSAVVLRLLGGLATIAEANFSWSYPLAAWASWLVPLAGYECLEAVRQRSRAGLAHNATEQAHV